VLREAILQAAVWKKDREPVAVGVNLSPDNLRDAMFQRSLDITLRAIGNPEVIISELPATTLTSPEQLESLSVMRKKGVRVAIDEVVESMDFGGVPADVVKLGRGLVQRLVTDPQALVQATEIVRAAKLLGRTVTAVGIEDESTWGRVIELGCDAAQGYSVAKPLSTTEFDIWRHRR
jgi:EAL domain-containing protein (putative c-di-GMP-specific phosphodiesterase class I)